MVLPVRIYGDLSLRKYSVNIDKFDKQVLKTLINNMFETISYYQYDSLSAVQVGHNVNLFIINSKKLNNDDFFTLKDVFINPEVVDKSKNKVLIKEKCASFPTLEESIYRYEWIKVKYTDSNFKVKENLFYGYDAALIQHELDHLHGVLMVDRLLNSSRKLNSKILSRIKNKKIKLYAQQ